MRRMIMRLISVFARKIMCLRGIIRLVRSIRQCPYSFLNVMTFITCFVKNRVVFEAVVSLKTIMVQGGQETLRGVGWRKKVLFTFGLSHPFLFPAPPPPHPPL